MALYRVAIKQRTGLSLKWSAWKGFINFGSENKFRSEIFFKNILGSEKNFGRKKDFGLKKFWVRKNFARVKNLGWKKFVFEIFLKPIKFLVLKFLDLINFGSGKKKFGFKNI